MFLHHLLKESQRPDPHNLTWSNFVANSARMHDAHPDAGATPSAAILGMDGDAEGQRPKSEARANHAVIEPVKELKTEGEDSAREEFRREWRELCETLSNLDKDFVPEHLNSYDELVRRAARFSFSVSALPE
jgi:hypothetical protein